MKCKNPKCRHKTVSFDKHSTCVTWLLSRCRTLLSPQKVDASFLKTPTPHSQSELTHVQFFPCCRRVLTALEFIQWDIFFYVKRDLSASISRFFFYSFFLIFLITERYSTVWIYHSLPLLLERDMGAFSNWGLLWKSCCELSSFCEPVFLRTFVFISLGYLSKGGVDEPKFFKKLSDLSCWLLWFFWAVLL